jgi:hypothetical protein
MQQLQDLQGSLGSSLLKSIVYLVIFIVLDFKMTQSVRKCLVLGFCGDYPTKSQNPHLLVKVCLVLVYWLV